MHFHTPFTQLRTEKKCPSRQNILSLFFANSDDFLTVLNTSIMNKMIQVEMRLLFFACEWSKKKI